MRLRKGKQPALRLAFADTVGSDQDAMYTVQYDTPEWRNTPNWRHGGGCNFSLADGHAEYWKWTNRKKTVELAQRSEAQSQATGGIARMLDEFDQNLGGDSIVYYLRGNVLDQYESETGSWSATNNEVGRRNRRTPVEPHTWRLLVGNQRKTIRQIITLLAGNEEYN